jgi:CO/xanthine dehydrogenase Mo-binding subunit
LQRFASREASESHNEDRRVDALDKVLGRTRYTADIDVGDVLYVRVARSTLPHAQLKDINASAAKEVPGVVRVVTAADVPGSKRFGAFIQDQPLLCDDEVRFVGDPVALVVAETPESAELGVRALQVEYERAPAVFDPNESLTGKVKVHETGNLIDQTTVRKGNVSQGLRDADFVISGTYETPMQEHAYLETEAALARPESDGGITVIGCMQAPFVVEHAVKMILGSSVPRVRIIVAPTGGAFGGKEDAPEGICAMAALATHLTGRPSLVSFSRKESITFHPKRHPMVIEREMGITKAGRITAVRERIIADGGAYASLGPRVLFAAACVATGAYEVPNVLIEGMVVYTNKVPTGAFRGFGKPQTLFAAEVQMDEAAERIGMDPLQFRVQNMLRLGSTTATGQVLKNSVGLEECFQRAVEASGWKTRRSASRSTGTIKRGIGMAAVIHPTGLGPVGVDVTSATVEVTGDDAILVRSGLVEYGQGIHTGYAGIVRRVLGLIGTRVRVELPDTMLALDSGPTVASRGTAMGGKALMIASERLKEKLAAVAADLLSASVPDIAFENDQVFCTGSPEKRISFSDLVMACRKRGLPLREDGWNRISDTSWDGEKGEGSPWVSYSFGVHVAEVEVDTETGKVDLLEYVAAHDSGTVISPAQFTGQIYGGVVQGLGYSLTEELVLDGGRIQNPSFLDYYIPTAADVCRITPILVEAPDGYGPFGAKGIGEPPIEPVAAAVGNAVYDAIGFPIRRLPYTAERVRAAILARSQGKP